MEWIHKNYIIKHQGVINALANFFLNGLLVLIFQHSMTTIPLSTKIGGTSISGDIIVTSFIASVIICIISTTITNNKIKKGHISRIKCETNKAIYKKLPGNMLIRAILIGFIYMFIASPILILLLGALGVSKMALWPFVVFKAAYVAINAGVVGSVSAWIALMKN